MFRNLNKAGGKLEKKREKESINKRNRPSLLDEFKLAKKSDHINESEAHILFLKVHSLSHYRLTKSWEPP